MQDKILLEAAQHMKQNQQKRIRSMFVRIMACVVVFCTTYALILPAITMEKQHCGLEEHTHSDSCYQKMIAEPTATLSCTYESLGIHVHTPACYSSENEIACGSADYVVHSHNDDCRDENGNVVCSLPVIREHTHTDACYRIPEAEEVHIHRETCYTKSRGEQICGKVEAEGHTHNDDCHARGDLKCQTPEGEGHIHGAECSEKVLACELTAEAHRHTDSCYQQQVCELPEDETHTHSEACNGNVLSCELTEQPHNHTDNCYQTKSLCDLPETEGHTHTDSCYTANLVCEKAEEEAHAHTDSCFAEVSTLTCGLEEGTTAETEAEPELVCGKKVIEVHTHNEVTCYENSEDDTQKRLICAKPAIAVHVHGDTCFVTSQVPEDALTCGITEGHIHADTCYDENDVLICTEVENHTHTDRCYGDWELICEKEAHTHTDDCCEMENPEENTSPIEAEMAALSRQMLFAAVPPKDYVVTPTPIEGSNVTWEIYKNGVGEWVLRFDGEGAIPDYENNDQKRFWLNYLTDNGSPWVHLEFGDNVTVVGKWAMKNLKLSSIKWGGIVETESYSFAYCNGPKIFEIPGTVKILGGYMTRYGGGIQSFVLHEGTEFIGEFAFSASGGTADAQLHIPASVTTFGGTPRASVIAYTVAEANPNYCAVDGVLYTKDMKMLISYPLNLKSEVFRIPDGVESIRSYAFQGASIGKLVVPPSVKILQDRFAEAGNLAEIYFEDGSQLESVGGLPLYLNLGLTNIRYPENTAIPLHSLFHYSYTSNLSRYTHFTVPNKITSIKNMQGELMNLETFTYNAENAEITATKLFNKCSAYNLVIGSEVNHLPRNFTCIVSPSRAVYFRGENTFTAENGAFSGAGEPLQTLSGKFFVDANGVLYLCTDEGTAKVVYTSGDVPANLTIPATIQTDDGTIYQVTAVGGNAFRSAEKLTALTFAAPEQITVLDPLAMANCPTLESVNGKTTKEEAEAIFPEDIEKTNLFHNTGLVRYAGDQDGDGILDGTGQASLTVKRDGATDMDISMKSAGSTMKWEAKENGTGLYTLLTGDTMTVTTSVGNTEGNEDYIYRIYFRVTKEDGALDILPGQSYTFDGQTVICCQTEEPNTVYLEFCPTVGATVNIPVTAVYPSPDSAGGGVEIWGVIQSRQEAEAAPNALVSGEKIIQVQWSTDPDDFELSKTGTTKVNIVSNGSGGGKPSGNLDWKIRIQRQTETTSAYGKDYAESVVFTDTITLPEGFSWNPALAAALQSGPVTLQRLNSINDSLVSGNVIYVRLYRSNTAGTAVNRSEAFWDTQKNTMSIRWEMSNMNASEMDANTVDFTIYPDAVSIDMSKIDTSAAYTVANDVTAEVRYHHSTPVILTASANATVSGGKSALSIKKTSIAPKYFGEDIPYTIDVYNNGAVPYVDQESRVFTVEDQMSVYSYIKPENMEKMFQLYKSGLVIQISGAVLAPWQSVTGVDGTAAWLNSGNSDIGTTGHTLLISLTEDGKYRVNELAGGKETTLCTADTAAEALKGAGYAVTKSAQYKCTWTLNDSDQTFTLDAGEHKYFYLYGTAKDSFGIITKDWPSTYPSTESVNIYNSYRLLSKNNINTVQHAFGGLSNGVKREAQVTKSAYKGNQEQYDGGSVADGDVLTYHLDFYHYGTGSYENLPMVDDLYGSQYLLVPVAGNSSLAEKNLPTHEDGETTYYVLKEGSYSNVTVGVDDEGNSLIAASVTVGKANDDVQVDIGGTEYTYSGIHTQINWYFPEKAGEEYWMQVRYKALVDLSLGGITYTIGNAVWMNDREDTRIYDFVWGNGTIIDFKKEIVTEKGDTYADDVTAKYSMIPQGGQVLYRLTLHNAGNSPFLLTGDNLGDALPNNHGIFQWIKGINVALTKIEADSNTVTYSKLDQWDIADSMGGLSGDNSQYILWPEDATIQFQNESTIYLYFTLTYPENGETDLWNRYAAAVGGNRIFNTLYVYQFPSTVEHDLLEPGKVLLQKGVAGIYHYTSNDTYHPTGSSRIYYNNQDMRKRAVMYYATLYNGGSKRLYLDDLYDNLPKGFTFMKMMNESLLEDWAGTSVSSIVTSGGIHSEGNSFANYSGSSVVYRSATITPEVMGNTVVFRLSAGTGDYAVLYDQEKGKYYLNSGEAITFAYTCDTGTTAGTENAATNTIAMVYDDYLDTGLAVIPMSELPVHAEASKYFLDNNDGTRLIKSNQEVVDQYGFPSSDNEKWLVSDVTVLRGGIRPGVTKYTDAYTPKDGSLQEYRYSALPTATVHWRVRLHNAGTLSLVDYTVSDIMPKPYVFEGDIIFRIYDAYGILLKEQRVATLSQRNPEDTSISVVRSDGNTVQLPLNGTWKDVGNYNQKVNMSVKYDENGNEVLSLDCKSPELAIPEGGYVDVSLSSRNPTNDHVNSVYINRATLQPNSQPFDNVGHGSMLKDENGNPIGAENFSPVNVSFGYATSSEKRVTEDSRPQNTAVSTDPTNSSIVLEDADSTFTYTLTVGNETEIPMTKLVIIDNLPQPDDRMPFDSSARRNSDFTVCFAEEPNFTVTVITKDGTQTELASNQYTLEFSTSTDFGGPQSRDWKGENTGKWSADRTDARAFRMIITDSDGTLIPHESKVEITFNARAEADAQPNMIAWNNFGYHYGLLNVSGELEAMPLTVGVAMPSVPSLKKQLVAPDGSAVNTEETLTFSFLVYTGEALEGSYESEEEWLAALTEADRSAQKFTVTVPAGASESALNVLDFAGWQWNHGEKFTVVELPSASKQYSFYRFDGSDSSQYTFTYDETDTQTVVCVNKLEQWEFGLTKTDTKGIPLSGAVFALYSPSEEDLIGADEAAQWNAQRILEPGTEGESTWYLKAVASTGEDGILTWTGLLEDSYYLLEIQAPEGYLLSDEGWILYRSMDRNRVVEVINKPVYALPETGGMGTSLFHLIGGTMLLIAFVALIIKKRVGYAE